MRNLKRVLSLTLASVMLLGMMVVGSSAAAGFPDVDENDNIEAIEVLQAVEVMVGDDRGFGPDRPVTRNEMAVVMGKLLNLDYNYYTSTCPFNDVANWARGWVGACYANGIVSGRGEGVYDGESTVTAVEAASMMMRALGYFKYQNDYADGFMVSTVRQGTKIGIFDQVGTDASTPMTRNQVAQMALNALRSGMVEPDGNTINLTTPDGSVFTGKVNYVYRTSAKPFASAISPIQATAVGSQNGGPIVELGEQLYNGKLTLAEDNVGGWDVKDEFGRPSRHWEYDGKKIGTYAKYELMRQDYTQKVTGKMLYDLLGKDVIDNYDIDVTIDGETTYNVLNGHGYFTKASMIRTNNDAVGATGDGVLTQVFVDGEYKTIDIAIINTYLAKARTDYNTRDNDVDLTVYKINDDASTNHYVKSIVDDDNQVDTLTEVMTVKGEDFEIEDVKEDDLYLVTVAEGEIQSMVKPEIVSEATINAFKNGSWVKSSDAQYDYASTAYYDDEVLDQYSQTNMKDVTYNIVLDNYGYLIGLELNEEVNQYVFLTGIDLGGSNLSAKNADANVIFLDGTMKTVRVNTEKSELASKPAGHDDDDGTDFTITGGGGEFAGGAMVNTWCTYTVDSNDVYTLKQVGDRSTARSADPAVRGAKKVAQSAMDMADLTMDVKDAGEVVINAKNVSLEGSRIRDDGSAIVGGDPGDPTHNLLGDFEYVYGDDKTVYINVDLKNIDDKNGVDATIVDKVASVSTGVKNVDITVTDLDDTTNHETFTAAPADEIYILYGDNGYIIGVITLDAEDNGTTSSWAYITGSVNQEEYLGNGDWRWTRNAIIDGKAVKLTEVDDDYDLLSPNKMQEGYWYELRFDADGNVTKLVPNNAPTTLNRIDFTNIINDKFITDVQDVRAATNGIDLGGGKDFDQNDSVLLYSNFTCGSHNGASNLVANLRYENGTLYTDNGISRGFSVDPAVKVVVTLSDKHGTGAFDQVLDTYEGWSGLETALKDLDCEKSAFDGFLSAVFSNGRATSIILDDRSGSHIGVVEDAPTMTVNVTKIGPNGINLGSETIQWNGTAFDGTEVTTPTGYTWASATALTFVENGTGNTTFTYTGGPSGSMRVMVEFYTDITDATTLVGRKPYATVSDVDEDGVFTVAGDLTIAAADYPTGYIAVTPANISGDGVFFTAGDTVTVKVEVEAAVTIHIQQKKADGTTETVDKTVAATTTYGTAITGSTSAHEWFKVTVPGAGGTTTTKYVEGNNTDAVDAGATINVIDKYVKVTTAITSVTSSSTAASIVNTDLTTMSAALKETVDNDGSTASFLKVGGTYTVEVTFTAVNNTPATLGATDLAATIATSNGVTFGASNVTVVEGGTQLASGAKANISITIGGTATNTATIAVALADKTA